MPGLHVCAYAGTHVAVTHVAVTHLAVTHVAVTHVAVTHVAATYVALPMWRYLARYRHIGGGVREWILWIFVLRPAVGSLRMLYATVACCAGSGSAACLDVWRRRLWWSPKLCLGRMPGAERFVLWVDPPFTLNFPVSGAVYK